MRRRRNAWVTLENFTRYVNFCGVLSCSYRGKRGYCLCRYDCDGFSNVGRPNATCYDCISIFKKQLSGCPQLLPVRCLSPCFDGFTKRQPARGITTFSKAARSDLISR